jgi:8-oxo-dGTP diphosphatase
MAIDKELTEKEYLASYDRRAFPLQSVAADVVLLTIRGGMLCVLLVERGGHPFRGYWALPGGFVNKDEDLDDAARRELAEETGVSEFTGHFEQLRTYGAPKRDPRARTFSVAYLGILPDPGDPVAADDARNAKWWPTADIEVIGRAELPHGRLAFDHFDIFSDGLERARAKLEYSTLALSFVEEPFTMGDLRRVYEAVWGRKLHEANFRRKVLSANDFVVPTGQTTSVGRGQPVELYRRGTGRVLYPPMLRPDNPYEIA